MKIYLHGRGSLSAAGRDGAAAWASYAAGRQTWAEDPATGLPVYPVTALPGRPEISDYVRARKPDRAAELALYAAVAAVKDAGWADQSFSLLVGSSRGPTAAWEAGYDHFLRGAALPPRTSPRTTPGSLGFALADYFGVASLGSSLSVTCSSGLHALVHGVALLRAGMADRVLVGGAEAPLTAFTLRQMEALRITAPVPAAGTAACRPLVIPASGMALGEGAAFFALSREPGPYELSALAFAREAGGSATGISPEGLALQQTLRAALAQQASADGIVAHAPGTRRGDAAERTAVAAVFAGKTPPPLLSFKWATGHTFGASGPLALDAALAAIDHGSFPASPYAGGWGRQEGVQSMLVNATGFGGNAVTVGVRKA